MVELKNEYLSIVVSEKGAELQSIKDKPLMNHLQPGASFMSKYEIIISGVTV